MTSIVLNKSDVRMSYSGRTTACVDPIRTVSTKLKPLSVSLRGSVRIGLNTESVKSVRYAPHEYSAARGPSKISKFLIIVRV